MHPPSQPHIERTFGESRRGVEVIGLTPGERSCLSLAWAVLDRASRGWRGVDMNPTNGRLPQQLRADRVGAHESPPKEVTDPSQPSPNTTIKNLRSDVFPPTLGRHRVDVMKGYGIAANGRRGMGSPDTSTKRC